MNKMLGAILVCIFLIASSLVIVLPVEAMKLSGDIRYVGGSGPGNYTRIQDAIDNSNVGDTVLVYSGLYIENVVVDKSIYLFGEDKNTTIINGNGSGVVVNILADYIKISGFTITNGGPLAQDFDAGIKIGSNYNTITDCNISSNKYYGLYLYKEPSATNNTIKANTFFNNSYGIFGYYAKTNKICLNTFTGNKDYGLFLIGLSDGNLVSDNKFVENNYAMRIKGSKLNIVIKNLFMKNEYGIYFCCGANNNIVYHNIFIKNTNWHANDVASNIWDNGSVGNYWDDYAGVDADSDGVGDTPYYISGGDSKDNYPLMEPLIDNIPPVVKILNPTEGYFHFSGIKLLPTFLNLIADTMGFGGFRVRPVQVEVEDDVNAARDISVYMYVKEDEQREMTWNSNKNLFERKWIRPDLGFYTLNITAEDTSGNIGYAEMEVWYFCFIPEVVAEIL